MFIIQRFDDQHQNPWRDHSGPWTRETADAEIIPAIRKTYPGCRLRLVPIKEMFTPNTEGTDDSAYWSLGRDYNKAIDLDPVAEAA